MTYTPQMANPFASPEAAAAGIGAAGDILSSAFGGGTSNRTKIKFQGEQFDQYIKSLDKHGIHRTAAVGGAPTPTASAGSGNQSGNQISQAFSSIARIFEVQAKTQAKKDLILMQAIASQNANQGNRQPVSAYAWSSPSTFSKSSGDAIATPVPEEVGDPRVELVPAQQTMSRKDDISTKAGIEPVWKKYTVTEQGDQLEIMGDDLAETFESPILFQAMMENPKNRYPLLRIASRWIDGKLPTGFHKKWAEKIARRVLRKSPTPRGSGDYRSRFPSHHYR